jgi:hypothetical protein
MRSAIKANYNGKIYRAVGNRIFPRDSRETDHEFLVYCLASFFDKGWYKTEKQKKDKDRHVIAKWYTEWREVRNALVRKTGGPGSAFPTGGIWSLLTLAYDVYCLEHTGNHDQGLIDRLQRQNDFQGALYEIRTAAIFARLGYKIIPIESKSQKHCEYFVEREKKIAIEVKSRAREGVLNTAGKVKYPSEIKEGIHRKLNEGLEHNVHGTPFLLFIDINMPVAQTDLIVPAQYKNWWKNMRHAIDSMPVGTKGSPDRFNGLFVTNFSYHYSSSEIINTGKFGEEAGAVFPKYCEEQLSPNTLLEIKDGVFQYGMVPRYL